MVIVKMGSVHQAVPGKLDSNANAEDWRRWEREFNFYFAAAEIKKKPKATQVAILLHVAGPDAQEIHSTFVFAVGESADDYETVLRKFKEHYEPRKNVVFARYTFWQRNQRPTEPVEKWITDLKTKAADCEFGDQKESIIRDKIVFGILDNRVKERMLREADLTLAKAEEFVRAADISKAQIAAMENPQVTTRSTQDEAVSQLTQGQGQRSAFTCKQRKFPRRKSTKLATGQEVQQNQVQGKAECKNCGRVHQAKQCPAYREQCHACGKLGHFRAKCRSTQRGQGQVKGASGQAVHSVALSDASDQLFVGKLSDAGDSDWRCTLKIGSSTVSCIIDTGSECNVLPLQTYRTVSREPLQSTERVLKAFFGQKVRAMGVSTLHVEHQGTVSPQEFVIIDGDVPAIVGRQSAVTMGLVKRIRALIDSDTLFEDYSDVFSGLGAYDRPYDIKLDHSVDPVVQPRHRVPYSRMEPLKAALQSLEEGGVIADADRPTDWVHNLVITEKKNGNLRLCIDPKPLNKAIKRERFQIPTPQDVQAKFHGAKVFSVVDMKDSYWHVVLSEESSYLCTFHTPWGRKRFLRMPFGISSASEVMQKRNEESFADIECVHVIADDIIVAAATEEDHDHAWRKLMQRAREKNVRFNRDKIQFKVPTVRYMGNLVTDKGLSPCPTKVQAIVGMPQPEDKKAVQRLLGMVRFLAQFMPNLSHMTAPLRNLLKEDIIWEWSPECDSAFNSLKEAISRPVLLKYFDISKPTTIETDASQYGLGSCLLQDGQPVVYASRSLTSAEENYSQIEKEMLAICFACKRFHQYIYGATVDVKTDHRPLEIIFKKPLAKVPSRLQRMLLQLQRYTLVVRYVPGSQLHVADALSRAYLKDGSMDGSPAADEVMIHTLASTRPVSAVKWQAVKEATDKDPTLTVVRRYVKEQWPKKPNVPMNVQPYWIRRDHILEEDGVLFVNDRIVVPVSLQSEMLNVIHESHLGIEKMKSRARPVLFWPGMNSDIEEVAKGCATCAKFRPANVKEPLIPHEVPDLPWKKVGVDVMTVDGLDYLVVVDYHSKWPELAKLERKTAQHIIMHLKSIFARHGVPEIMMSDNMPFASYEFGLFAEEWGINQVTSSPTYARSNGQVERTIQTLKRLMQKAKQDHRDQYIALLEYRNTPVSGLLYSPAQMLMSRTLRSKMPVASKHLEPKIVNATKDLSRRQKRQKDVHDRGAVPLQPLQPGQPVFIRWGKRWRPARVVRQHDTAPRSYWVLTDEGSEVRRNRVDLRPSLAPPVNLSQPPPVNIPRAVPDRPPRRRVSRPRYLDDYVV